MRAVVGVCMLALGLAGASFADDQGAAVSPAAQYAEAIVEAEQRIFQDPAASRSDAAQARTREFVAGLIGAAWRLSYAASRLDRPAFFRSDETTGLPGLYNPDNIYSSALLDDTATYRITGIRGTHAHLTFQLIDTLPLTGLGKDLLVIDLNAHDVGQDQPFEMVIGGLPRDRLWWPMPAGAKAVLVRQTFNDWQNETATTLTIERVTPAIGNGADVPDRLSMAAQFLRQMTALWVDTYLQGLRRIPVNTLPPVRASKDTAGGLSGQQSIMGRFALDKDHALIIRATPVAATYQSIQVGNEWFVTPDPARHQSSLNGSQTRVGRDGQVRYVISLRDPGVANWLDTGGSEDGYFMMRWQGLRDPSTAVAQPSIERVRLADLRAHLADDAMDFSAEQRVRQQALRQRPPGTP